MTGWSVDFEPEWVSKWSCLPRRDWTNHCRPVFELGIGRIAMLPSLPRSVTDTGTLNEHVVGPVTKLSSGWCRIFNKRYLPVYGGNEPTLMIPTVNYNSDGLSDTYCCILLRTSRILGCTLVFWVRQTERTLFSSVKRFLCIYIFHGCT
jgi:hypothetical protein